MKEAFEEIIERLKEVGNLEITVHGGRCNGKTLTLGYVKGIENAIEIVNQVVGEYNDRIFINGQCCWQSCACTEKCQECNRYTLSDSDIDWYESIEDWNEEFGGDINVGSNRSME